MRREHPSGGSQLKSTGVRKKSTLMLKDCHLCGKRYTLRWAPPSHSSRPNSLTHSLTDLCDFLRDVVSSVLDFGRDDGRLGRRRRVSFLLTGLREVEGNQWEPVDGAVPVDVGVGGRAE